MKKILVRKNLYLNYSLTNVYRAMHYLRLKKKGGGEHWRWIRGGGELKEKYT